MKPADIFSHWGLVRNGLLSVIDQFKETDLSYIPYPGGWAVGQILIHIANAEEGWFRYVVTKEIKEWPKHLQFENYPTRSEILDVLDSVHGATNQYLGSVTEKNLTIKIQTP